MFTDFTLALRQLRRSPGFTMTAVLTLALGIGATTAIFSLIEQVMLRSLPVAKPQELWRIGDKIHCCGYGGYTQDEEFSIFSWDLYQQFRDNTPEFSDLAAMQAGSAALAVRRDGSGQQAETRNGEYVSGNFFHTFGVGPWIGRVLEPNDDREGAAPVAVMSYHVWKDKYNSEPSVVGATYQINGYPFTIVGVAAPGFYGAKLTGWAMPDIWIPVTTELLLDGPRAQLKMPDQHWLDIIGRVRPGTDPKKLEARLRVELHAWQASHLADMGPQDKEVVQQQKLYLTPGGAGVDELRESYRDGMTILLSAGSCVLLLACANIANLLLARGLKNRQQTSIRVALGAPRARLVRKALVESVTLSVIGGAVGIGVAYAGTRLIIQMAFKIGSADNFVPIQSAPSWQVLLFALGVSVLTGVLFGIAPAWMSSHAEPVEALRGARGSTSSKAHWPQKALVIAQAAISLVLLAAAAMLGQSLRNMRNQDFGFETRGRYIASIDPSLANYKAERLNPLYDLIEERLQAIPGVRRVSAAMYAPMSGNNWSKDIRVEGKPEPSAKDDYDATWVRVTPGFFETIGNRMVMGRAITDQDTATTRSVAVINEAFGRKFFKGENPIGRHFGPDQQQYARMYEVVGVAANMRYLPWELREPDRPMFFVAEAQTARYNEPQGVAGELSSHFLNNVIIWGPDNPTDLETQVRKILGQIDPALVLYTVDSYGHVFDSDFAQQNMIANLTLLFGALGLMLAAVGLYGVTAYVVEQRTSEIGVRMALGADRGQVIGMVLRGALFQAGIGLAIGLPLAVGVGKLIASQLFGIKPWDPLMLNVATILLAIAVLTAAMIPARRAAALNPVEALRSE
jgi:putative ABC transport system permease protein